MTTLLRTVKRMQVQGYEAVTIDYPEDWTGVGFIRWRLSGPGRFVTQHAAIPAPILQAMVLEAGSSQEHPFGEHPFEPDGPRVSVDDLEERLARAVAPEELRIVYSHYRVVSRDEDQPYLVEDDLDRIAIEGYVHVVMPPSSEGRQQTFDLSSPTWLDLCRNVNQALVDQGIRNRVVLVDVRHLAYDVWVLVLEDIEHREGAKR